MSDKLRLEIVTPYGSIFSEDVSEVSAKGSEGDFGVLSGHAPYITTLNAGSLSCKTDSGTRYFFVNWGFAEIKDDRMLVLADSAERSEDIDVHRAMEAKKRAEERLRKQENIDFKRAEASLDRAIMRIKMAEDRKQSK